MYSTNYYKYSTRFYTEIGFKNVDILSIFAKNIAKTCACAFFTNILKVLFFLYQYRRLELGNYSCREAL